MGKRATFGGEANAILYMMHQHPRPPPNPPNPLPTSTKYARPKKHMYAVDLKRRERGAESDKRGCVHQPLPVARAYSVPLTTAESATMRRQRMTTSTAPGMEYNS